MTGEELNNKDRAIINCPVCFRVMWNNSVCRHGQVPPPAQDAPKELPTKDKYGRRHDDRA